MSTADSRVVWVAVVFQYQFAPGTLAPIASRAPLRGRGMAEMAGCDRLTGLVAQELDGGQELRQIVEQFRRVPELEVVVGPAEEPA